MADPPPPLGRQPISRILETGIKSVDTLFTIGKGQRLGIFAGSGVGKSTLLGEMARHAKADVNVIALVGERGREVGEFVDKVLGPEGLARSVVIVATSDRPAVERLAAAYAAHTLAEHFRDGGLDVLLMMDSVTRFCQAQRDIGLAAGEPPVTRGFPPSAFAILPRLLERAGTGMVGSITGLYTVLIEGDDENDPVGDAVRAILDGHLFLSRRLAGQAIYPAIDPLLSISRLLVDLADKPHYRLAMKARELWSEYERVRDLVEVGAYRKGADPRVDQAIAVRPRLLEFVRQDMGQVISRAEALKQLTQIIGEQK
jgi:FliI/YscN family ATPase